MPRKTSRGLITATEAAAITGRERHDIAALVKAGILAEVPARPGSYRRFDREAVEKYAAEQKAKARPGASG